MTVLCEKKAATIFSQLYTINMAMAFQREGNKYSIKRIKHVGGTPQFQKIMSGEKSVSQGPAKAVFEYRWLVES